MNTEKRVPVQAIRVHLICECGTEMQATGTARLTAPPTYLHRCPACDNRNATRAVYPYIDYEVIP